MAPTARLAEKLKLLGLATDDNPASAPKAAVPSRKKLTFRVFFPLPPFEPGLHFNALKAGHGTFNFTGLLLGVGGKQLQKIKQESNARVEVVNAYGNLNGMHPDPLDEDLHALVTADNMAKLQRAVDLVVQVLSPTNGSYEPLKVEPGGSARLKVAQTNSAKTSGAPAKPKLTKPLPPVSSSGSRSRASLDGGSSSCSTKGMPPSPALTPVTPAATGSRHGSMFASGSSGPSSCSSSRTPTPSPSVISARCGRCSAEPHLPHTHPDCSTAAGSSMSGVGGSKDTHSHLEGFQLPPAALPAAPRPAFPASEWPALPLSQDNSSTTSTSSNISVSSSSSSVGKSGLSAGVGKAGHSQSTNASSGDSSRGDSKSSRNLKTVQPSVEYVSIPMSHLRLQSLDVQQPGLGCDSLQEAPQEPHVSTGGLGATNEQATEQQAGDSDSGCVSSMPVQQQSMLAYAGQPPAVISVDCDDAKEHGMLSPLTPQAQQYQYQHQQKAQQRLKQPGVEQGQGAGAMLQSNGQAAGTGVFGLGLDWQPAADNSGGSSCAAACLPPSVLQHGPSYGQQLNPLQQQQQQQPCDLDLLMLRQRAGLLSQAYLHCDGPVSGVSCACAGIAAPPVALCGPYACSDSSVSLLGLSTGCCQVQGLAGANSSTGTVGGAVQEGFDGAGSAHQQLQDGFACQNYQRQQREQHTRMVAEAAAAANYSSWDGCSTLSSSMPCGPLPQLATTGGGQAGSLPHLGWELSNYASRAQTAAVAAAASAAFGAPSMTDTGVAGDVLSSTSWEGGAGALTASGFLASKSIW